MNGLPLELSLAQLEARLREVADAVFAEAGGGMAATETKRDGSIVTATDTRMQQRIGELLASINTSYPLLGEEMTLQQQQQAIAASGPCWILDPVDGTSNFAVGLPFYCVSLALVEQGRSLLGLVYDPCRGECFSAERGAGAWLNRVPLHCPRDAELSRAIGLVDGKRLTSPLGEALLRGSPCHSLRNLGAVALEWCWLAAGRGQVYLHGRQQLWDYAASQLILSEAGGAARDLNGDPVEPMALAPRGMVAATDARLLGEWFDWIQTHAI